MKANSYQLQFGALTIDLERYRVLINDQPIVVSYREYALLVYLASRSGRVVYKRQLLEEGLGRHDSGGIRMVDEYLRHLKGVLERNGCSCIEIIDDNGYRFNAGA